MKIEDMFNEEVILEEEILQPGTPTQAEIKRQVSFIRDNFADTQLGDKSVRDIVEDDVNFPTIDEKFREILRRMDPPSAKFWRDNRRKILKEES